MKNFGEKVEWAYPMLSEGPSEQKPINISEKRERGRIQGLPKFFGLLGY